MLFASSMLWSFLLNSLYSPFMLLVLPLLCDLNLTKPSLTFENVVIQCHCMNYGYIRVCVWIWSMRNSRKNSRRLTKHRNASSHPVYLPVKSERLVKKVTCGFALLRSFLKTRHLLWLCVCYVTLLSSFTTVHVLHKLMICNPDFCIASQDIQNMEDERQQLKKRIERQRKKVGISSLSQHYNSQKLSLGLLKGLQVHRPIWQLQLIFSLCVLYLPCWPKVQDNVPNHETVLVAATAHRQEKEREVELAEQKMDQKNQVCALNLPLNYLLLFFWTVLAVTSSAIVSFDSLLLPSGSREIKYLE